MRCATMTHTGADRRGPRKCDHYRRRSDVEIDDPVQRDVHGGGRVRPLDVTEAKAARRIVARQWPERCGWWQCRARAWVAVTLAHQPFEGHWAAVLRDRARAGRANSRSRMSLRNDDRERRSRAARASIRSSCSRSSATVVTTSVDFRLAITASTLNRNGQHATRRTVRCPPRRGSICAWGVSYQLDVGTLGVRRIPSARPAAPGAPGQSPRRTE